MVAKHLCREFPEEIAEGVTRRQQEDEYSSIHGKRYGNKPDDYFSAESMRDSLERHMPVYDRIRSWCDSAVMEEFNRLRALEEEVQRLREIILKQVQWLKDYRHSHFAKALRDELDRRD